MSKGFSGVDFENKIAHRGNRFIVRSALFLSIIAVILVFGIVLTVVSSNHLMNIEPSKVSNVPSNILPSYSTCSFESFDEQTTLSGWFFKCEDPITTIIVVHNSGSNRLPFGVNMIDMVELWLENDYNVFMFDLRNSGDSEGDITGYGYLEWQDVLGAIAQVKMISVTTDVVLYGIGSGTTACVMAYDQLPPPGLTEAELNNYSDDIISLGFDQSYIKGMIFDSPAKNSDDYISPVVRQNEFLGVITANLVPYAIRVSTGVSDSVNLAAEISRLPVPICIIYGGHDTFIGAEKISQIVDERNRLNSSITVYQMIPGAGYLESFNVGHDMYIDTVMRYLQSYFIKGQ
ncbi:Lysophospholipase, alpha-beta hydrolase superfamily [Ruminococcaceae bacterium KH2T8]|nr:Lysophospholipase, alpha-beta hydrolase superfamily [Ruminococcaceae bacterium KH2T8]